jgi:hypothetical protein
LGARRAGAARDGGASVVLRHPARDVIAHAHLDMEAQLIVDVGLGARSPKAEVAT